MIHASKVVARLTSCEAINTRIHAPQSVIDDQIDPAPLCRKPSAFYARLSQSDIGRLFIASLLSIDWPTQEGKINVVFVIDEVTDVADEEPEQ